MSLFNPETFMDSVVTGASATSVTPIPAGEYSAVIDEIKPRSVNRKDGSQGLALDITWQVLNPELAAQLGREKIIARQSLLLDTTPAGTLDLGKDRNVQLGKVRAAVGQNNPNEPWKPANLRGAGPAKILISHRPDQRDSSMIYAEVTRVTSM